MSSLLDIMYYYAIFNYDNIESFNNSTNTSSSNDDQKDLISIEDASLIPEITYFQSETPTTRHKLSSQPPLQSSPIRRAGSSPAVTEATILELSPSAAHSNRASCAICILDYKAGDTLKVLPNCHHVFHKDCIIPWLTERSGHCPLCRVTVRVGSKEVGKRLWSRSIHCPGVGCSIQ